MKRLTILAIFLSVSLSSCFSSHCQVNDQAITYINRYCDSVDRVTNYLAESFSGESVHLDYVKSGNCILKIFEQPVGYRFINASNKYYFQNNNLVYVYADIEITTDDGSSLTLELYKIYFSENEIIMNLVAEKTYNSDSLYHGDADPLRINEKLRKEARFSERPIQKELKERLLKASRIYLHEQTNQNRENSLKNCSSPFI
jgi:hypothetical protein